MKKLLFVLGCLLLVGCASQKVEVSKDNIDAYKFKYSYEALNETIDSSGNQRRSVDIAADNPIKYVSEKEVIDMIDNGDSFLVYFGFPMCPYCRTVIEMMLKTAQEYEIETIYYVPTRDESGNRTFNEVYGLDEEGNVIKTFNGSPYYQELMMRVANVIDKNYSFTDDNNVVHEVDSKWLTQPCLIYIQQGVALEAVSGVPDIENQYVELSEADLKYEHDTFAKLFAQVQLFKQENEDINACNFGSDCG